MNQLQCLQLKGVLLGISDDRNRFGDREKVPFKVRVLRIHKMTCPGLGQAAWVKTILVHGLLVLSCSPNARKDANLLGK